MFSFVIEKTGDAKASPVFLTNDSNFDKRYIPMIFAPLENGCEPFYKGGAKRIDNLQIKCTT